MKILLFILVILAISSCGKIDKDCDQGEIKTAFSGNCIPSDGRVNYYGKTSFYCFSDSLAIGINVKDKTFHISYKDEYGRTGGIGGFKYTDTDNFHSQCETDSFGVSNTTIYIDDVSQLDNLPPTIKINLYQNDWNIPFTRFDSTTIRLSKR
ncbi:MAG TPA: hypothetical protein ENK91_16590 [Bacteroidetes bacterium]|nr:hypothetical protein [Bacteroidota bacterium]